MLETALGMTDLQIKAATALGQVATAVAIGYVAYRQWKTADQQAATARKKLKADLFDKRIAAFGEVEDSVRALDSDRERYEIAMRIQCAARRFRYLFRQPEYEVAKAIAQDATELVEKANALSKLNRCHVRYEVLEREVSDLWNALAKNFDELYERCTPALTLQE